VHGDGAFLLHDLDAHAGVPLLQAVGDSQTQHPRADDPHSLPVLETQRYRDPKRCPTKGLM